jgi:Zn-finger nucleic acid-binding protein
MASRRTVTYVQQVQPPFEATCLHCKGKIIFDFSENPEEIPQNVLNELSGVFSFCANCEKAWLNTGTLASMMEKTKSLMDKLSASYEAMEKFQTRVTESKQKEKPVKTLRMQQQTQPWLPQETDLLLEASFDITPAEVRATRRMTVAAQFESAAPVVTPMAAQFAPAPVAAQFAPAPMAVQFMHPAAPVPNCMEEITRQLGQNPGFGNRAIPILKQEMQTCGANALLLSVPQYAVNERDSARDLVVWASNNQAWQRRLCEIFASFSVPPQDDLHTALDRLGLQQLINITGLLKSILLDPHSVHYSAMGVHEIPSIHWRSDRLDAMKELEIFARNRRMENVLKSLTTQV